MLTELKSLLDSVVEPYSNPLAEIMLTLAILAFIVSVCALAFLLFDRRWERRERLAEDGAKGAKKQPFSTGTKVFACILAASLAGGTLLGFSMVRSPEEKAADIAIADSRSNTSAEIAGLLVDSFSKDGNTPKEPYTIRISTRSYSVEILTEGEKSFPGKQTRSSILGVVYGEMSPGLANRTLIRWTEKLEAGSRPIAFVTYTDGSQSYLEATSNSKGELVLVEPKG